jgi:uncharacterized protein
MSPIDPLPQPEEPGKPHSEAVTPAPGPLEGVQRSPSVRPPAPPPPLPVVRPFPLHPNFGWGFLWCIGVLLVTQVPGAIVSVVMIVAGSLLFPNLVPRNTGTGVEGIRALLHNSFIQVSIAAALFVAHALLILVSLVVLRIVVGRDWPRQVALRRPSWTHVALVVMCVPAFMVLANAAYFLVRHVLRVPSVSDWGLGMEEMESMITGWLVPPAVFLIGVMPALSEELWCRAFLGRGLVGKHGIVLGVLGTSFLFGFLHIDPCQGLMAMVLGVVLHYVYLTTRSLLMPMLLHFLNNSLAVVLPSIPGLGQLEKAAPSDAGIMIPVLVGSAVLLIGVCRALYQSRARLVDLGAGPIWRPSYPGVACPPADSGTRIITPALSQDSLALLAAGLTAFAMGVAMTVQKLW